jgi:hypothetical protein
MAENRSETIAATNKVFFVHTNGVKRVLIQIALFVVEPDPASTLCPTAPALSVINVRE